MPSVPAPLRGAPALPARYRPIRPLGAGGAGDVLLCEDLGGPPSPKAVKILLPDLPAELVRCFREEFHILATLEHPGLARVFELGELPGGRAFYTSEYVEGRDLRAEGGSLRRLCTAAAAVCRTLAYVHARGYVHNDVKPSNVLVPDAAEGSRLLDFGLAGVDRLPGRTVAGTPGYIAPERLAGRTWDGRADFFALGATLYSILGGRRVTEHTETDRALAELRTGFRPIADLRPDLPPVLADLIARLVALDPARRPQSAAEIIGALADAIGEALPLETPGTARCYALSSLLVGRETEIDAALAALADAARGRPCLVTLQAAPGMGKSRILREIAWRAFTQEWKVSRHACREREAGLEPLLGIAAELGVAIDGGEADAIAFRLHDALSAPVSGRRLILLDDAQSATDAVWRVCYLLARAARASRSPLVVLLGVDPDRMSVPARQLVALIDLDGFHRAVTLAPLPDSALRRIVVSLFGPDVLPEAMERSVAERSGGNPLLLEEIVRELVETGAVRSTASGWTVGPAVEADVSPSPRLEEMLRRRCRDLPRDAARALAGLAALGGGADRPAIATVAGPEVDVDLGLSLLGDRGLVRIEGPRVALAHDALQPLAIAGIDDEGRRTSNARAAAWLEAHGGDHALLARAFTEAGQPARAFEHAAAAGTRALRAGDARRAVGWLKEAASAASNAGISGERLASALGDLGEAYRQAGRLRESLETFERAFAENEPTPSRDAVSRAGAAVRAAAFLAEPETAGVWLDRAQAAVPEGDRLAQAQVDWRRGTIAFYLRRYEEARTWLTGVLATLATLPDSEELAFFRAQICLTLSALLPLFDRVEGRRVAEQAVREAERCGNASFLWAARTNLASMDLHTGAPLEPVERALRQCAEELERIGALDQVPIALVNLTQAERRLGRPGAGAAALDRARALTRDSHFVRTHVATVEAQDAFWSDDPEKALREVEVALAEWQSWMDFSLLLAIGAGAAARCGRRTDAANMAARAEAEVARGAAPLSRTLAAIARAHVTALDDAHAGGVALRAAAEALETSGQRGDAPIFLRDAGRHLARAGAVEDAGRCFARARELLRAAGAVSALAEIDRIEAEAAGQRGPAPVSRLLAPLDDARGAADLAGRVAAAARQLAGRWNGGHASAFAEAVVGALVRLGDTPPAASAGAATLAETPGRRTFGRRESRMLELTLGGLEVRGPFGGIVGGSPAMGQVVDAVRRLAESDTPVLLIGETGTGKEVLARALHAASARAAGPFAVLDCASVPASLFEAEIFGYRRGAFSGAVEDHAGVVERANGGFLMLDNVSDLPANLQAKLLRILQDRHVRPLGGGTEVGVDVRVVATSNVDLAREVEAKRFRADLYYRLNVVEIRLPPVRERMEDLPELCAHLLHRMGHRGMRLTAGAMRRLMDHRWPGNVRELENELARAATLAGRGTIGEGQLSARLLRSATRSVPVSAKGPMRERVRAFEREIMRQALLEHGGNHTRAAEALGLTRVGFNLKLARLGLEQAGRPGRPARGARRGRSSFS